MNRSFHESYYYKNLANNNKSRRLWLSYSPSKDLIFCISCKLYGLPKAQKSNLALNGSNDWSNIQRIINNHEHSHNHIQLEISRGLYLQSNRIDLNDQLIICANREVANNREVVRTVIEVLIFAARQNISLRGHNENVLSLNRGIFLELLKVIGRHSAPVMMHLEKINKSNNNRLTFMSSKSQEKLLSILGEMVRAQILKDVKNACHFAVIIDTTTDISNQEQFTFIVRYVNSTGVIEERLLALETASDATEQGLFNTFCTITSKYDINWEKHLCAQSFDGAASMQGIYSGLRSFIQHKNPRAIYVWCFAHILNLVVVDTCDSCTDTKNFFGDVQSLVFFLKARKRAAVFIECRKKMYKDDRVLRLKSFSDTRWTSHGKVLNVIFCKYKALIDALEVLQNSSDRITASSSRAFLKTISTFKFVLCLIFFKNIFIVTTPLSNYLQCKTIDFFEAIQLVNVAKKKLSEMRSECKYEVFINEVKEFANFNNVPEKDFKEMRKRTRELLTGETPDDNSNVSSMVQFKIKTYYAALDKITMSLHERFSQSQEILKDLAILNPDRLMAKDSQNLPSDCFQHISLWLENINTDQLGTEYIQFKNNIYELINGLELPTEIHDDTSKVQNTEIDENDDCSSNDGNLNIMDEYIDLNKNVTITTIIQLLTKYGLDSAFPNLHVAYRALATIPVPSASAERSFSKVKLIKTRLRSTMGQGRLESLLLLSCERDIPIDINIVIDKFSQSSDLLKNALTFK
ncbi:unnamed protein product [Macrosiphum euphorbiae]|uniref:Zinc finger MYM-type protein 1-like n=1 Tax=Macrosiphum euphorbiae TaxID=13131 RepID=A0AAV0WFU2_9HEMI|nr:unnamed protein product [Macrosiphum euphorbiae]